MGPTAIGKTDLAVDLVQQFPLQIVSVDSAQVYRGMDIGTGKPDAQTLERAPHRLIDISDPANAYSAADFRADAIREIEDVLSQGTTPLLVGGTMLYFKVLRDGLAEMPQADPAIRQEIEDLAEAEGWEAVHAKLQQVDPTSAARIHPNDPQRLSRALEIYLVSGKTMTDFHEIETSNAANQSAAQAYNFHFFAIQPEDRSVLHERIEQRFRRMLDQGLVDEVDSLYQRGDLSPLLPSIKSVGYRQVWQYLEGELDYDAMVEKSIIATRQLAKRQLTWLRSWENLQGLTESSAKSVAKPIASLLNFGESASIYRP